jgi:hypothetical protein
MTFDDETSFCDGLEMWEYEFTHTLKEILEWMLKRPHPFVVRRSAPVAVALVWGLHQSYLDSTT